MLPEPLETPVHRVPGWRIQTDPLAIRREPVILSEAKDLSCFSLLTSNL
jgi:hypothetical protein